MNGYGRGEDKKSPGVGSVITRETFGMTLLLFSVILLVISIIGNYILGEIGTSITAFLFGALGFFVYPALVLCIYLSVVMISGKKLLPWRWVLKGSAATVCVFLIVHLALTSASLGGGFGAYMSHCWNAAETSASASTPGGVFLGLLVYPVQAVLSPVGAYVLFSLLLAVCAFFLLKPFFALAFSRRGPRAEKPAKEKKTGGKNVSEADAAPTPRTVRYRTAPPAEAPVREQPQYEQPRYEQPRYEQPQYEQPRYEQPRYEQPRYEQPRYEQPSEPQYDAPADDAGLFGGYSGMDILYSSPAQDFKRNLIYNQDSYFNSRVRRSSIEPSDSPARRTDYGIPASFEKRTEPRQSGASAPSYTDRYGAQAELTREPMPRKIVEQRPDSRPDGYTVRAEDINYPAKPSYRAPITPPEEPHDRYAKDVPFEEEFTSAPNIFDEPSAAEDVRTEEPERVKRAPVSPEPEPVKSEHPPVSAEPAEKKDELHDEFRSLFSRPRAERTRIDPSFGREFGRGEEKNFLDKIDDPPEYGGLRGLDDYTPRRKNTFEEPRGRETFEEPQESESFEEPRGRETFEEPRGRETFEEPRGRETFEEPRGRESAEEEDLGDSRAIGGLRRSDANLFDDDAPPEESAPRPAEKKSKAAPRPERHVYRPYQQPSMALFRQYDDTIAVPPEEVERNSEIIIETLAGFRVDAEIMRVTTGPSVTRYDLDIPHNISLNTVTRRGGEIAMRLHARDGVNMYANNESGLISIEVPNSVRATVGLRSVMQANEYLGGTRDALMFAIGKDIEGRNVCGNITKMKHMLIAGATGSGKSVCLNAILISLICKYSPEDLRLILIDPKKVEFTVYDGLPHLMINEIVADAQKAVMALNWAIKEMERRFDLFEQTTRSGTVVRNLDEYNDTLSEGDQKLPKIVIVVDELADLMSVAKKDIEERIQRIAQKARAAGIHLIIATQRPSVDVITGVIKGNLPTRMAFRVIQEVDSRTILDESGAEKLLGNGDMLYKSEGMFYCSRVQCAFISSEEVQAIVEEIKTHNEAYFDPDVTDYINRNEEAEENYDDDDEDGGGAITPEYIRALGMVVKLGSASISLIQRRCSVGYNHAGKIMEWMETMGYVSPFDGKARARAVLLTKEEFESKYGPLD